MNYIEEFHNKLLEHKLPDYVDDAIMDAVEEVDRRAREEERERIEAVFMEKVPPHLLSLEDSVWLKRLLNKAFKHQ